MNALDATDYIVRTHDRMRWFIHPDYVDSFPPAFNTMTNLNELPPDWRLFNNKGGRCTVRIPDASNDNAVIYKRYRPKFWGEYLKYLVVPTRAIREWALNLAFRKAGLPTPLPLAFGEGRQLGIWHRSALILQEVRPGTPLGDAFPALDASSAGELLAKAAALCARIHNAGFYYRDLHANNILLRDKDGRTELCLIDLHEVSHVGNVSFSQATDDLGRLFSSLPLTNSMSDDFLDIYLDGRRAVKEDKDTWRGAITGVVKRIQDRALKKHGHVLPSQTTQEG